MTTFVAFTPSATSLFRFSATMDGQSCTFVVTWNLFGQRYYLNCYQSDGTLVFSLPIIGSPTGVALDTLQWANGTVAATAHVPHGFSVGETLNLNVSGCLPVIYNGFVEALITSPTTFSYPLSVDPGPATAKGSVAHDVNMAGGYFLESTLVFRTANQQFELGP